MVFHLVTGRTLWHIDQDDNIDEAALEELAEWSSATCSKRLEVVSDPVARSLLEKLLEAEPQDRMRHFPNGAEDLLEHPFFQPASAGPGLQLLGPSGAEGAAASGGQYLTHLHRAEEAQALVRAPNHVPGAPFGGFLINWLATHHPDVKEADDQMLKRFRDSVDDTMTSMTEELESAASQAEKDLQKLQRQLDEKPWRRNHVSVQVAAEKERALKERITTTEGAQADAEQDLEHVRRLDKYRTLRYLLSLTWKLYHYRNFSSHSGLDGETNNTHRLELRHARLLLSTCAQFCLCLLHLLDDCPKLTAACAGDGRGRAEHAAQLQRWALRCLELLREQALEDCSQPMPNEPLRFYAALDDEGHDLWYLAFYHLVDAKKYLEGDNHAQLCSLPRPADGDGLDWLQMLQQELYNAFVAKRKIASNGFRDVGWGWTMAQELLQSARGELPAWATADDCVSLTDSRREELQAHMAAFLGGRPNRSAAHARPSIQKQARDESAPFPQ